MQQARKPAKACLKHVCDQLTNLIGLLSVRSSSSSLFQPESSFSCEFWVSSWYDGKTRAL
jgi:hypothetical protein